MEKSEEIVSKEKCRPANIRDGILSILFAVAQQGQALFKQNHVCLGDSDPLIQKLSPKFHLGESTEKQVFCFLTSEL